MDLELFGKRLSHLRITKGVSARDMSLSIGQSPSYINNIENGVSFPSMTVFFYICEYLNITPSEFFDLTSKDPSREKDLMRELKGLSSDQLDNFMALIKSVKKQ